MVAYLNYNYYSVSVKKNPTKNMIIFDLKPKETSKSL